MQNRGIGGKSKWRRLFSCAALIIFAIVFVAPGAMGNTVYLRGEIESSDNDYVVVTVYQTAVGAAPAALVIFLTFDKSEIDVVAPENESRLQLPAIHEGNGFSITDAYHDVIDDAPGRACLAVAVYRKSGVTTLQSGELLSFPLQITEFGKTLSSVRIEAVEADSYVFINGAPFASSAAATDERSLTVRMEPLTIPVNCTPPNPPGQLRASRCYRNQIVLTWQPPDTHNVFEYQLYRSATNDIGQAVPVSADWLAETIFVDRLDEDALETASSGCACSSERYYYWVRARDTGTQCASNFSEPPARGAPAPWWFPTLSCRGSKE